MKNVFWLLIILLFSNHYIISQGTDCTDCPKRDFALFDLDVVIPDPSTSGDTLNQALWLEFFMVAGGIHEVLVDDQESRQCLNFFDGQMAVINQWEGSQYTYGSTSPSLPPDPGTFEMDYYLTGSLGKSANSKAYAILVNIYSGDGDVVASTTNIYNFSVSGIQNGKNTGQMILPLIEKIREFEKRKRVEDPEIAIGPDYKMENNIKIEPEQEKIKAGETTNVKVTIIDCDGVALKDMEAKLSCDGGSFDPEKITTNGDGIAESKLTADCDPGNYTITLEFEFRPPCSPEKNTAGQTKEIEVDAADEFNLVYNHSMTLSYGGQFELTSTGEGKIPCTINWDADPPSIKGEGTVSAKWDGNADECKFVGSSSFKLNFKGKVVYSSDGVASIELNKVGESDLGGDFKIICKSITQTVPESMPIPVQEEDRVLKFVFKDGDTQSFSVSGTDYQYSIELKCK